MSLGKASSRILIAEGPSGELLGFFVLQLIAHTEPLFVVPSRRASGIAEGLADHMLEFMQEAKARGWMLVTDNPLVAKMSEARGMVPIQSSMKVFVAK